MQKNLERLEEIVENMRAAHQLGRGTVGASAADLEVLEWALGRLYWFISRKIYTGQKDG